MNKSAIPGHWACHWVCRRCEVEGQSVEAEPRCWNCGVQVRIKYQTRVSMDPAPTPGVDL